MKEQEFTREQRIKLEIQRLHREHANCAHCASLRDQMARLSQLIPPDPIEANGMRYVFDPPEWWKDRLREVAEKLGPL